MQQPNWIIDQYILESRSTVGDLVQAVRDCGSDVHLTRYVPLSEQQDYRLDWVDQPTIIYGTHGFVSKCKVGYTPGAFGLTTNMNCDHYYSHIPSDWLLNSDFYIVPYKVFKQRAERLLIEQDLFIRPVNGFKTFAGQVITYDNAIDTFKTLDHLSSCVDHTLIMVCQSKKLDSEYRFVIADRQVIDGSEYRWDNILDIRRDWPNDAWELADQMARHHWQPDVVYTCDVAIYQSRPYIIEINSFSCAGLYACDKNLIVQAVNRAAIKEFYGEDL